MGGGVWQIMDVAVPADHQKEHEKKKWEIEKKINK